MLKNNKSIEKTLIDDNKVFYFIFTGNEKKENIDYDKLDKLIEQCFEKIKSCDDMIRNVTWLRTIFKDFDESYLEIHFFKGENKKIVVYIDKQLCLYEEVKKDNKFIYRIGKELKLYNNDKENSNILSIISRKIDQIKLLKDITMLKLSDNERLLCEIYYLFYGENPDLCSSDISIKMQMMLLILEKFDIFFDYQFAKRGRQVPVCYEVANFVKKMKPLGKVRVKLTLPPKKRQMIKEIGNKINNYISQSDNEVEELIRIGTSLYDSDFSQDDKNKDKIIGLIKTSKIV